MENPFILPKPKKSEKVLYIKNLKHTHLKPVFSFKFKCGSYNKKTVLLKISKLNIFSTQHEFLAFILF